LAFKSLIPPRLLDGLQGAFKFFQGGRCQYTLQLIARNHLRGKRQPKVPWLVLQNDSVPIDDDI
jgi:hypothetical protein